jgi:hypothetical protein
MAAVHCGDASPGWGRNVTFALSPKSARSERSEVRPAGPVGLAEDGWESLGYRYWTMLAHRIHVWYICYHLGYIDGKCYHIYHTWTLWVGQSWMGNLILYSVLVSRSLFLWYLRLAMDTGENLERSCNLSLPWNHIHYHSLSFTICRSMRSCLSLGYCTYIANMNRKYTLRS